MKNKSVKLALYCLLAALVMTCNSSNRVDNTQSMTSIRIETPDSISLGAITPGGTVAVYLTVDGQEDKKKLCTDAGTKFVCTWPDALTAATHTFMLEYFHLHPNYPANPAFDNKNGIKFWQFSKVAAIIAGTETTVSFSVSNGLENCGPECYSDIDDPATQNKTLLCNYDELVLYNTDPFNSDSDGDGMPDWWEAIYKTAPCAKANQADCCVTNCLNPLADDHLTDSDSDGQNNLAEFNAKTDPTSGSAVTACNDSVDNDGDGVTDLADSGCLNASDTDETRADHVCDDGLDNDGDGGKDYNRAGGDGGCSALDDATEYYDTGGPQCDDGIDNDTPPDGKIDRGGLDVPANADPKCSSATDNTEQDVGGTWIEVGGSATGVGISDTSGNSVGPKIVVDSSGYPIVAWQDSTSGDNEIYVKQWNVSDWVEMGAGAASGGGISNNSGNSEGISIVLDTSGYPVVAWDDDSSGNDEIYIKRWNGSSWVEIGAGSATGSGISNTAGGSHIPSVAIYQGNPIVTWQEGAGIVYVRRWNGSSWINVGSPFGGSIAYGPKIAVDGAGDPVVAWENYNGSNYQLYVRKWNGSSWVEMGSGSASGGGISSVPYPYNAEWPQIAIDGSGNPIVVWVDGRSGDKETYIKRWNGSSWVEIGSGSASGGGISNNGGDSDSVKVSTDSSGNPIVAWMDNTVGSWRTYLKYWSGSAWLELGTGSATGNGLFFTTGSTPFPSISTDSSGIPFVVWQDNSSGNYEIYLKRWQP